MTNGGMKIIDKRKNWEARVEMKIFQIPKSELSTYDKIVYAILCGHANKEGNAHPYIATIAEESSCSERQVQRALSRLEECHLVIRHVQISPEKGYINSIYEIYGFDAYTLSDCVSPGVPPDSHQAGDCRAEHIEVEQPQENSKTYSPTESAETAPDTPRPVEISEIPSAMRPTVELFLHKTGRANITPEELIPLRELERAHYPARVQQEIDVAAERFRRGGRDPAALTLDYLWQSLKRQPGRKPRERASPGESKRANAEREANIAWEKERHEEVMREVRKWRETLE